MGNTLLKKNIANYQKAIDIPSPTAKRLRLHFAVSRQETPPSPLCESTGFHHLGRNHSPGK